MEEHRSHLVEREYSWEVIAEMFLDRYIELIDDGGISELRNQK